MIGCLGCSFNLPKAWASSHKRIAAFNRPVLSAIADQELPVADRFAVFLAACIHPHRQPFAAGGVLVSQQCDELSSPDRATKSEAFSSESGPYAALLHQVLADRQFAVEVPFYTFSAPVNIDV